MLVVAVQERPTISSLAVRRQQGIRHRDDQEGAEGHRARRGPHLRPLGARPRRAGAEAPVHHARPLRRPSVQTTVTPQERNRVAIIFTIDEGSPSRIERINIIGTKAYTERQLRDEMTLTTPGWLTWYSKNDQYSKQKLQADLEALRSYYQNRGYLEFEIESTQVSISPDREDIYITINVREGPRYTVGDVRLAGDLQVDERELQPAGPRSSRARPSRASGCRRRSRTCPTGSAPTATRSPTSTRCRTSTARTRRPRSPSTSIRAAASTCAGSTSAATRARATRSSAARRASSSRPGSTASASSAPRSGCAAWATSTTSPSRRRRWPVRTTRSTPSSRSPSGTPATCSPASATRARRAWCSTARSRSRTSSAPATRSRWRSTRARSTGVYSIAFTEPYWTVDGVSRTLELYHRRINPTSLSISQYRSETTGAAVGFGVPITETDTVNVGFRVERTKLELFQDSPPQYIDFVNQFGSTTNSVVLNGGLGARHARRRALPQPGAPAEPAGRGRAPARRPRVL